MRLLKGADTVLAIWVQLLEELQESVCTLCTPACLCVYLCMCVCVCVMWKGMAWGRSVEPDSLFHLTLAWRWVCVEVEVGGSGVGGVWGFYWNSLTETGSQREQTRHRMSQRIRRSQKTRIYY